MAGAGYRTFASGEVLTAANTQTYLMDQTITVFADSAARDAAISSPTEGQYAFLKDTNGLTFYNGSAWETFSQGGETGSVLQVVSTTKTDTYSASTLTVAFTGNVTGMSASITPVATSSKILVLLSANGAISDANPVIAGRVLRGSTAIGVGATEGSRTSLGGVAGHDRASALIANLNLTVLDSPSTISEITYNFQMFNILGATKTLYLNRNEADTNSAATVRAASTITLIEVAG